MERFLSDGVKREALKSLQHEVALFELGSHCLLQAKGIRAISSKPKTLEFHSDSNQHA